MYQERYNEISESINRTLESIDLINNGRELLKENKMLKNGNALLNVGGGLYVSSKITDEEKFITEIGAGLLIENSAQDSDEILKRRLEKNTAVLDRLMKDKKQAEGIIYDITYKLEEAVGKDV
jgi:prefoldin alpha subunit